VSSEILFEVTKDHLETGLRGIPVGYCTTSKVDPQKGLYYKGTAVSELKDKRPEEVIHLLLYGKEGTEAEIDNFAKELAKRSHISGATARHISSLPKEGHPMKMFSASVLILGMLEGGGDYKEDAINLIAKIPTVAAHVMNNHAGWGDTPPCNPELGYMENFAYLLQCKKDDEEHFKEALRLFNILHFDHGGGNLSAFVGKAVASGLEDLYGAYAASLCALEGPRHGRANQDCLAFVEEVIQASGGNLTAESIEKVIRERLEKKQLIFGFGHAVLRAEDVRATIFYDFVQKHYPEHPLVKTVLLLREVVPKILKENPKIANPYPNVDAVSGTLLTSVGLPYPEYYTLLFGVARAVGVASQIIYERCDAREGKGTPIVRPKYLYRS